MNSEKDTFTTIKAPSQGIYKEKGSKFIAFAFAVYSEDEIKMMLDQLRKEYFDARHHCYAWRLGVDGIRFRSNDDGEPSGTAGKPILGQLQSAGLSNILLVVIRYFGGIKLGTSGLINAYKTAAQDAIAQAEKIERHVSGTCLVEFSYGLMNEVMRIAKEFQLKQENPRFDLDCSFQFTERQSLMDTIIHKLEDAGAKITLLATFDARP